MKSENCKKFVITIDDTGKEISREEVRYENYSMLIGDIQRYADNLKVFSKSDFEKMYVQCSKRVLYGMNVIEHIIDILIQSGDTEKIEMSMKMAFGKSIKAISQKFDISVASVRDKTCVQLGLTTSGFIELLTQFYKTKGVDTRIFDLYRDVTNNKGTRYLSDAVSLEVIEHYQNTITNKLKVTERFKWG